MEVSGTKLRENIYRLLDESLETGEVITIRRKGRLLRIVPEPVKGRLSALRRRSTINGDPEEIVHMDWSGEWNG